MTFALQPVITSRISHLDHDHPTRRIGLLVGTFAVCLYAGYFGAGQGVMLLAVFGLALNVSMQHLHGLRSAVSIINNTIAAGIFIISGHHVIWAAAGLLAIGTLVGGWLGTIAAKRLPAKALRAIVVVVGAATFVVLVVRG